jgi:hypothetical protein
MATTRALEEREFLLCMGCAALYFSIQCGQDCHKCKTRSQCLEKLSSHNSKIAGTCSACYKRAHEHEQYSEPELAMAA